MNALELIKVTYSFSIYIHFEIMVISENVKFYLIQHLIWVAIFPESR